VTAAIFNLGQLLAQGRYCVERLSETQSRPMRSAIGRSAAPCRAVLLTPRLP
jgi:hypothetical protein